MVSTQEHLTMSNASVKALGYLEVGVSSLADWQGYAQDVLGVACLPVGDALTLRYDAECWRIRLVETGEDDIRCAGFQVGSLEGLGAMRARLEAQGVNVTEAEEAEARDRGVDTLLHCNDPFGLRIELYVGDRRIGAPFVSPRGVSGFVTGEQGLGHVVLMVPERETAEAFYMDGLGFLLSDHIEMGPPGRQLTLTFLHCNPRHHTIALVPVPAPRRLNHVMLQLESLDDVGSGLDAAGRAGVKISSSLGRHTNDQMVSFYMQTPSGFDVEYGFGGREIDDATWRPGKYDAPSIWGHKGNLNPA
jgi:2,3-dihydroxybiphenyl 1,2-dioxygenase